MGTYRVTGARRVRGHKPGEKFEHPFTPGQEAALIAAGHIEPEPGSAPKRKPSRKKVAPKAPPKPKPEALQAPSEPEAREDDAPSITESDRPTPAGTDEKEK